MYNTIENVTVLEEIGYYSYDWDIVQFGKTDKGVLVFRYGAGCSCNCIEDVPWKEYHDPEDWGELKQRAESNTDAAKAVEFLAACAEHIREAS